MRFHLVFIVIFALDAFCGPSLREVCAEGEDSHLRMVAELAKIATLTPQTNSYLGRARMDRLEESWASQQKSPQSPRDTFVLAFQLGSARLEQGLVREAAELLDQAMSLLLKANTESPGQIEIALVIEVVRLQALAAFRLAETENCCATHHPQSCIFPLSEAVLHRREEGSRRAMVYLSRLLQGAQLTEIYAAEAIWLYNLAAMTLGEHPEAVPLPWRVPLPKFSVDPVPGAFPAFPNIAEAAGVATFSLAGAAVADDCDGDGWIDLVVSCWDPRVPMIYFHNRKDGTFEKREAGIEQILGGGNMRHADYDNDGDVDILVLRGAWLGAQGQHPNSLLQNDGSGRFRDVTFDVGLALPAWPTQTAEWADYDLDGDLDLFIGNESNDKLKVASQLFRNDGGTFVDVAAEAGLAVHRFVKGCTWGDYDGDRYPDLFISCLDGPNQLFHNQGDGTFQDVSEILGSTAGPARSFPTWFFDYNNDGWLDLFVSSYESRAKEYIEYYRGAPLPDDRLSSLFRNDAGKGFTGVTRSAGLVRPMLPMGSNFGDLNNDGFLDIYLGSGTPDFGKIIPNALFINESGVFKDETVSSRMGHLQKGHAVSMADFDRDGDLDVFEQMGGAYPCDAFYDVLYQNPGFGKHWLSVKLVGVQSNRSGIGARVAVKLRDADGEVQWRYQWMGEGGSFGSNPLELHFGLGDAKIIDRVEVFWPVSGKTDVLESVELNQRVVIRESKVEG